MPATILLDRLRGKTCAPARRQLFARPRAGHVAARTERCAKSAGDHRWWWSGGLRNVSWQEWQFRPTWRKVALKVSSSVVCASASLVSAANLSIAAFHSSGRSQMAARARVSPVFEFVGEQARELRGLLGEGRKDRVRLRRIERDLAANDLAADLGLLAATFHQRLALRDDARMGGDGAGADGKDRDGEHGANVSVSLKSGGDVRGQSFAARVL